MFLSHVFISTVKEVEVCLNTISIPIPTGQFPFPCIHIFIPIPILLLCPIPPPKPLPKNHEGIKKLFSARLVK